eukprot:g4447.t1
MEGSATAAGGSMLKAVGSDPTRREVEMASFSEEDAGPMAPFSDGESKSSLGVQLQKGDEGFGPSQRHLNGAGKSGRGNVGGDHPAGKRGSLFTPGRFPHKIEKLLHPVESVKLEVTKFEVAVRLLVLALALALALTVRFYSEQKTVGVTCAVSKNLTEAAMSSVSEHIALDLNRAAKVAVLLQHHLSGPGQIIEMSAAETRFAEAYEDNAGAPLHLLLWRIVELFGVDMMYAARPGLSSPAAAAAAAAAAAGSSSSSIGNTSSSAAGATVSNYVFYGVRVHEESGRPVLVTVDSTSPVDNTTGRWLRQQRYFDPETGDIDPSGPFRMELYSPDERPWFLAVRESNGPRFTDEYVYASSQARGITYALPWGVSYDGITTPGMNFTSEAPPGDPAESEIVVGVDLTLSTIDDILRNARDTAFEGGGDTSDAASDASDTPTTTEVALIRAYQAVDGSLKYAVVAESNRDAATTQSELSEARTDVIEACEAGSGEQPIITAWRSRAIDAVREAANATAPTMSEYELRLRVPAAYVHDEIDSSRGSFWRQFTIVGVLVFLIEVARILLRRRFSSGVDTFITVFNTLALAGLLLVVYTGMDSAAVDQVRILNDGVGRITVQRVKERLNQSLVTANPLMSNLTGIHQRVLGLPPFANSSSSATAITEGVEQLFILSKVFMVVLNTFPNRSYSRAETAGTQMQVVSPHIESTALMFHHTDEIPTGPTPPGAVEETFFHIKWATQDELSRKDGQIWGFNEGETFTSAALDGLERGSGNPLAALKPSDFYFTLEEWVTGATADANLNDGQLLWTKAEMISTIPFWESRRCQDGRSCTDRVITTVQMVDAPGDGQDGSLITGCSWLVRTSLIDVEDTVMDGMRSHGHGDAKFVLDNSGVLLLADHPGLTQSTSNSSSTTLRVLGDVTLSDHSLVSRIQNELLLRYPDAAGNVRAMYEAINRDPTQWKNASLGFSVNGLSKIDIYVDQVGDQLGLGFPWLIFSTIGETSRPGYASFRQTEISTIVVSLTAMVLFVYLALALRPKDLKLRRGNKRLQITEPAQLRFVMSSIGPEEDGTMTRENRALRYIMDASAGINIFTTLHYEITKQNWRHSVYCLSRDPFYNLIMIVAVVVHIMVARNFLLTLVSAGHIFLLIIIIVLFIAVLGLMLLSRRYGASSEFKDILDAFNTLFVYLVGAENYPEMVYQATSCPINPTEHYRNGACDNALLYLYFVPVLLIGMFYIVALTIAIFQNTYSNHSKAEASLEKLRLRAGLVAAFCALDENDDGDLSLAEMSDFLDLHVMVSFKNFQRYGQDGAKEEVALEVHEFVEMCEQLLPLLRAEHGDVTLRVFAKGKYFWYQPNDHTTQVANRYDFIVTIVPFAIVLVMWMANPPSNGQVFDSWVNFSEDQDDQLSLRQDLRRFILAFPMARIVSIVQP